MLGKDLMRYASNSLKSLWNLDIASILTIMNLTDQDLYLNMMVTVSAILDNVSALAIGRCLVIF